MRAGKAMGKGIEMGGSSSSEGGKTQEVRVALNWKTQGSYHLIVDNPGRIWASLWQWRTKADYLVWEWEVS